MPMAGRGPIFSDPSCQNCAEEEQTVANKFRDYVCLQTRMWHIYSTALNVCGERIVH